MPEVSLLSSSRPRPVRNPHPDSPSGTGRGGRPRGFPHQRAFLSALATGCLRVTRPDGSGAAFAVRGGFAQVRDNVLTVLTPECAGPGELDAAAVDAELSRLHGGEAGKSREACNQKAAQLAWAKACRLALEGAPPGPQR